jgi:hypothetical protein
VRPDALSRRGRGVARLASASEINTLGCMITATTCSNLAEAELLHSLLVENGIEAFVLDDAFGGAIRLQVADEQADDAKRILREAAQALAKEEDAEDPDQPRG